VSAPQTICITGGSGFMGRHLTRRLLADGREVTILDLAPLPADLEKAGARFVRGSITDPPTVANALRGSEAVVHLAAKVSDFGRAEGFALLNVGATRIVVEQARNSARRLVHMSSVAVFDYRTGYRDADEETPAGGHEFPYGQTKLQAEAIVREAHEPGVFETTIVRPGLFPYGPEDRHAVLPMFSALESRVPLLVDRGEALLSTSYIDNLLDGVLLCLDHPQAAGRTFHICDDERLSWRELIRAIARELDVRPNLLSTPGWLAYPAAALLEALWSFWRRPGAPPLTRYRIRTSTCDLHFSNARARRLLGYRPAVSLDEGIRRTVEWYRSHRSAS
jgi:nucleoside-diphosphate-sugar epimerase